MSVNIGLGSRMWLRTTDSACLDRSDAKEETCSEYNGFCHRANCVLSGSVYEVNCLAMQDKTRAAPYLCESYTDEVTIAPKGQAV